MSVSLIERGSLLSMNVENEAEYLVISVQHGLITKKDFIDSLVELYDQDLLTWEEYVAHKASGTLTQEELLALSECVARDLCSKGSKI